MQSGVQSKSMARTPPEAAHQSAFGRPGEFPSRPGTTQLSSKPVSDRCGVNLFQSCQPAP